MKIRYLTLLTTLVFLGFTVSAFAKGKPVEPVVVYDVALTSGVFKFDPVLVTLDSREYLKSFLTDALEIKRPPSNSDNPNERTEEQVVWDTVIANCAGPLVGTIDTMTLNFDDWVVGRNGDDGILYINLKSIRLPSNDSPEKEIQIILRLINAPELTAAYPPTDTKDNRVQTFKLDSYVIWGKPLSGMSVKGKNKGWDTCYHSVLASDVVIPPADLEINYLGPLPLGSE